jgi:hypothetical protein
VDKQLRRECISSHHSLAEPARGRRAACIEEDRVKAAEITVVLRRYYKEAFPPQAAILDICSSWVSHFPADYKPKRAVGLGECSPLPFQFHAGARAEQLSMEI